MNFAWFNFIGSKKLGLSLKETGRLTMREFSAMYQCYKDDHDLEQQMLLKGITYKYLADRARKQDEWF